MSTGPRDLVARIPDSDVWPMPLVLLGIWFAPRRAGRQLARRGLASALAAHAAGVSIICLVLAGVATMSGSTDDPASSAGFVTAIWTEISTWVGSLVSIGGFSLVGMTLLVIAAAIAEIYYWLFGLVVLGAWMGVDLPRRRLLSRAAVLTGYATMWLPVLILAWGLAAGLTAASYSSPGALHLWGKLAALALATFAPTCVLALSLRLATGMGDVTAPSRNEDADPLCEACGYNLRATSFDHYCPECGRPAAESLATVNRCNGWEVRRKSFAAAAAAIVLTAEAFFSTVRMKGPVGPARRFAVTATAISAALFGVMGAAANAAETALHRSSWTLPTESAVALGRDALALSGIWIFTTLTISMVTANVIANASRRRGDRIGAGGATKIACYLTALTVAWAPLFGLATGGLAMLQRLGTGGSHDQRFILTRALLGMAVLVWYWIVATRAYRRCRFANT